MHGRRGYGRLFFYYNAAMMKAVTTNLTKRVKIATLQEHGVAFGITPCGNIAFV